MTKPQADAPPADLAVAAEAGITDSDELARVRRQQQDLAIARTAYPY